MTAKDWSEWRWAFSFDGVETWLLSGIMHGKKRLNAFSDYTRPVRYFRSAWVYPLLLLWVRYGLKARPACTVANAADVKWHKMQWRIYARGANGKVEVCDLSNNNLCILYRHNFYESKNIKKMNVLKRKIFVFIIASNFQQIKYKLSIRAITYFYTHLFLLWRISKHSNNNILIIYRPT